MTNKDELIGSKKEIENKSYIKTAKLQTQDERNEQDNS